MFHLLCVVLTSLVVGVIARVILSAVVTALIGIALFHWSFLTASSGHYDPDQSAFFDVSLLGAIILLAIIVPSRANELE